MFSTSILVSNNFIIFISHTIVTIINPDFGMLYSEEMAGGVCIDPWRYDEDLDVGFGRVGTKGVACLS